jgi:hypothetical protein
MVDNCCNGNLVGRCLRNQSIRASLWLRVNDISLCGLHAIRVTFLGLLCTILDVSIHYYVFRNEQQYLQPHGSGSWDEVKGSTVLAPRVATLGRPLLKWSFRLPVVSIQRLRRDKVDCETWNHSGTEIWSSLLRDSIVANRCQHKESVKLLYINIKYKKMINRNFKL